MIEGKKYYFPTGGLPSQNDIMTQRAVFTEAYAVIPKGCMRDIATSFLPHWSNTRAWVLARPLSGFSETFSQYIMEVLPGGGSTKPDTDLSAQSVLFVTDGQGFLQINGPPLRAEGHGPFIIVLPGHPALLQVTLHHPIDKSRHQRPLPVVVIHFILPLLDDHALHVRQHLPQNALQEHLLVVGQSVEGRRAIAIRRPPPSRLDRERGKAQLRQDAPSQRPADDPATRRLRIYINNTVVVLAPHVV